MTELEPTAAKHALTEFDAECPKCNPVGYAAEHAKHRGQWVARPLAGHRPYHLGCPKCSPAEYARRFATHRAQLVTA